VTTPARRLLRAVDVVAGAVTFILLGPALSAHADPSLDEVRQQLDAKSGDLEKIVEAYNKANEELKTTQGQATALAEKMKPLEDKLNAASAVVGQISQAAFKGGKVGTINALLSSNSGSTFVDQLGTLDQIARYQQHQISGYKDAKATFDVEKSKLDSLLATQSATEQDLGGKKKQIEGEVADLKKLRDKLTGAGGGGGGSSNGSGPKYNGPTPPYVPGKAGAAVNFAYGAIGAPNVWASAKYPPGYDCSGLTMAAWAAAGVSLPHSAAMQYNQLPKVSRADLQPGDLIVTNGQGHVGIYVGDGMAIHASTYGVPVKKAPMSDLGPVVGYVRPS